MQMTDKPTLKLDWCSHKAAKFACENWHYSKSMPVGKTVKVGVWENNKYIGCIIYSYGANKNIGTPYKLNQFQCVELTRIALNKHFYPVSKMITISLKLLKKHCPDLKLVVSYADCDQNHIGGIYKATNWIYEGKKTVGARSAFIINGKKVHPKSIHSMGYRQTLESVKKNIDKNATIFFTKGKHKYLMPLNKEIRKVVEPLRKPYPKRTEQESNAPGIQPGGSGAVPTCALQNTVG